MKQYKPVYFINIGIGLIGIPPVLFGVSRISDILSSLSEKRIGYLIIGLVIITYTLINTIIFLKCYKKKTYIIRYINITLIGIITAYVAFSVLLIIYNYVG
jgi:hypothetical protein